MKFELNPSESNPITSSTTSFSSGKNLPDRNINPGNLKSTQTNTFRTFSSEAEGYAALQNDLQAKFTGNTRTGLNGDSTLYDFSKTYAPRGDNNNPEKYVSDLANNLGATPDTKLKDLLPYIPEVSQAIARNEGYSKARNFSTNIGLNPYLNQTAIPQTPAPQAPVPAPEDPSIVSRIWGGVKQSASDLYHFVPKLGKELTTGTGALGAVAAVGQGVLDAPAHIANSTLNLAENVFGVQNTKKALSAIATAPLAFLNPVDAAINKGGVAQEASKKLFNNLQQKDVSFRLGTPSKTLNDVTGYQENDVQKGLREFTRDMVPYIIPVGSTEKAVTELGVQSAKTAELLNAAKTAKKTVDALKAETAVIDAGIILGKATQADKALHLEKLLSATDELASATTKANEAKTVLDAQQKATKVLNDAATAKKGMLGKTVDAVKNNSIASGTIDATVRGQFNDDYSKSFSDRIKNTVDSFGQNLLFEGAAKIIKAPFNKDYTSAEMKVAKDRINKTPVETFQQHIDTLGTPENTKTSVVLKPTENFDQQTFENQIKGNKKNQTIAESIQNNPSIESVANGTHVPDTSSSDMLKSFNDYNEKTTKVEYKPLNKKDYQGNDIVATNKVDANGNAKITIDSNYVKKYGLESPEVRHAHGHELSEVMSKRISSSGEDVRQMWRNYEGNKTELDKTFSEYAQKNNMSVDEFLNKTHDEINKNAPRQYIPFEEKWSDAFSTIINDPVKGKQDFPHLFEYVTDLAGVKKEGIGAKADVNMRADTTHITANDIKDLVQNEKDNMPAKEPNGTTIKDTTAKTEKQPQNRDYGLQKTENKGLVSTMEGDKKMGTPISEDVKNQAIAQSERYTTTNQNISDAASKSGLTASKLMDIKKEHGIWNPVETDAAKQIIVNNNKYKQDIVLKYKKADGNIDFTKMSQDEIAGIHKAVNENVALVMMGSDNASEVGRLQQMAKTTYTAEDAMSIYNIDEALHKGGLISEDALSLSKKELDKRIKNTRELVEMNPYIDSYNKMWYAMTLSGPSTFVNNLLQGVFNNGREVLGKFAVGDVKGGIAYLKAAHEALVKSLIGEKGVFPQLGEMSRLLVDNRSLDEIRDVLKNHSILSKDAGFQERVNILLGDNKKYVLSDTIKNSKISGFLPLYERAARTWEIIGMLPSLADKPSRAMGEAGQRAFLETMHPEVGQHIIDELAKHNGAEMALTAPIKSKTLEKLNGLLQQIKQAHLTDNSYLNNKITLSKVERAKLNLTNQEKVGAGVANIVQGATGVITRNIFPFVKLIIKVVDNLGDTVIGPAQLRYLGKNEWIEKASQRILDDSPIKPENPELFRKTIEERLHANQRGLMMMGTMTPVLLGSLAASGLVQFTSTGPADKKTKDALAGEMGVNVYPYNSFRIAGTDMWIPTALLGPTGFTYGVAMGGATDVYKYGKTKDTAYNPIDIGLIGLMGLSARITSQAGLQNALAAYDVSVAANTKKTRTFVSNIIAQAIPSPLGFTQTANIINELKGNPSNAHDTYDPNILKNIRNIIISNYTSGLNDDYLPKIYDALGNVKEKRGLPMASAAKVHSDPTVDFLLKEKIVPQLSNRFEDVVDKDGNKRPMTVKEWEVYSMIAGKTLKNNLDARVPKYQEVINQYPDQKEEVVKLVKQDIKNIKGAFKKHITEDVVNGTVNIDNAKEYIKKLSPFVQEYDENGTPINAEE